MDEKGPGVRDRDVEDAAKYFLLQLKRCFSCFIDAHIADHSDLRIGRKF
jgi:hypothetical protein